ncbi:hypothetical protein [Halorubrum sp. 48-1-W]|uniref:hypothetical protein n=1 Tax=Halorubrum sp. 48-1-W TaxID=2249761 RepID=UPI001F53E5B5|nr:hypothetical protein [Halorubrum sp. 48-1-W]
MVHEGQGNVAARVSNGTWSRDGYRRSIDEIDLPPTVRTYASRYDRVLGERDVFLWKWIHNLFDEFTLSSVDDDARDGLYESKTLLTIYVTVLDDLAEVSDERATFEVGRRLPFRARAGAEGTVRSDGDRETTDADAGTTRSDVDHDVIDFLADLWNEIETSIEDGPRYDEFVDVFEYDFRQTCNAMEYSRLLNHNVSMANRTEAERYDAYNMTVFPYACLDLMYSPSFDREEFGVLRSLLCEIQQMARIGNWITTWERELAEGDVSSGVVVCALRRGVISPDELEDADDRTVDQLVDRIESNGIESEFIREWDIRNRTVRKRAVEIRSVDGEAVVDGIRTVMNHHLASEGNK